MTLYIAYGSNLNRAQMQHRCPGARAVKKIYLQDARLVFRHVLDVEFHKGSTVPCVVWEINKAMEHDLDRYEGVASGHYAKEVIFLEDGREAMLYVMLTDGICPPTSDYYFRVKRGYQDFKLDLAPLRKAFRHSVKKKAHSDATRRRAHGQKLMQLDKPKEKAAMPADVAAHKLNAMLAKSRDTTMQWAQHREAKALHAANSKKVTNLNDWLADRRASGKAY